MLADVVVVAGELVVAVRHQLLGLLGRAACSTQRLDHQVVAAHLVEHHHVERCCGRALFGEAAHVEASRMGTPVHQLVDRARVAVEAEHHVDVAREQLVELVVGESVRVIVLRQQHHQVHHVHHAHTQIRHPFAQQLRGGEDLLRRNVARAGEHDVG